MDPLDTSGTVKVADVKVPRRLTFMANAEQVAMLKLKQDEEEQAEMANSDNHHQMTSITFAEPTPPQAVKFGKDSYRHDSYAPITSKFSMASTAHTSVSEDDDLYKCEIAKSHGPARPISVFTSFNKFGWNGTNRKSIMPEGAHDMDWENDADQTQQSRRPKSAYAPGPIRGRARSISQWARRGTIFEVYEKAKVRGKHLERKRWVQITFEYTIYLLLLCFVYFGLIGFPIWNGAVYWMYIIIKDKFIISWGWSITIGIAFLYAFTPLLILFEPAPAEKLPTSYKDTSPSANDTALLIPCYKSEHIIGPTIEAALKIFPASSIFVLANGNSETPLDNTADVCERYGVGHVWCNIGSKIVAQYIGCHKAKDFKNILLIDDDCALPPNFPVVSDRLVGKIKSVGYTIKSVGPNSSKGTWCQQAQDLEYKLSGIQRAFAGKLGSATFPHGAISLWDREFLLKTFDDHPGFSVSEDWFFGDSCRRLGGRIIMCSSIFVETETPASVFFASGGSRGGFGEMTIFSQRFKRWNFFFVNGMYYNMKYIIKSWNLGWWEIGAKLFVFQEVYETLLYLLTPFILPISFIIRPAFCGILMAGTFGMYLVNVIIFNALHLRLKKERISWTVVLVYYMPYKIVLSFVNVASCYWSLWMYAKYFANRHPKIIENSRVVAAAIHINHSDDDGRPKSVATRIKSFARPKSYAKTRPISTMDPTSQGHQSIYGYPLTGVTRPISNDRSTGAPAVPQPKIKFAPTAVQHGVPQPNVNYAPPSVEPVVPQAEFDFAPPSVQPVVPHAEFDFAPPFVQPTVPQAEFGFAPQAFEPAPRAPRGPKRPFSTPATYHYSGAQDAEAQDTDMYPQGAAQGWSPV